MIIIDQYIYINICLSSLSECARCGHTLLGLQHTDWWLALKAQKMIIAEFANSVDPDEVAHYEPPHLDLYYLPSSL